MTEAKQEKTAKGGPKGERSELIKKSHKWPYILRALCVL